MGVTDSGPSCDTCHSWPYTPGSLKCNGCHGLPPNGAAFPNIAGSHAKHAALANVTCSTCHNGAGCSTVNSYHLNGVPDVFFPASYNSKSAIAAFDATNKVCSNISCHGGPRAQTQTQAASASSTPAQTPSWYGGSIATASQCTACHVYGTQEFNSYLSGKHYLHVWDPNGGPSPKLACTACHDTTKLTTSHFAGLSTSSFEGLPRATILNSVNYTGTSCNPGCHGTESW